MADAIVFLLPEWNEKWIDDYGNRDAILPAIQDISDRDCGGLASFPG